MGWLALLASALFAQADAGDAPKGPVSPEAFSRAEAAVGRMGRALGELKDATATFRRREFKDGERLPEEVMELKVRSSPASIYLKWIGAQHQGREVIWQKGKRAGQLIVHTGSFPDITAEIEPGSWMAMRGTRHSIDQAGFAYTVEMLVRDLGTLRAKPQCLLGLEEEGAKTVQGARSLCFDVSQDKKACPELYGQRARFCVIDGVDLPSSVEIWDFEDGAVRLVEQYGYGDVKVNVGLSDDDFDPENAAYGF